jgi:hypothetical protein
MENKVQFSMTTPMRYSSKLHQRETSLSGIEVLEHLEQSGKYVAQFDNLLGTTCTRKK